MGLVCLSLVSVGAFSNAAKWDKKTRQVHEAAGVNICWQVVAHPRRQSSISISHPVVGTV
jgi:hypothetical protein